MRPARWPVFALPWIGDSRESVIQGAQEVAYGASFRVFLAGPGSSPSLLVGCAVRGRMAPRLTPVLPVAVTEAGSMRRRRCKQATSSNEEGTHMRTRLTLAVLLVLITSLVLAAPSQAKQMNKMEPLIVNEISTAGLPDHPETWYGTVSGAINGTQEGWGLPFDTGPGSISPIFLGGVSAGYNLIITDRGNITYYTLGTYIDGTWEFRSVGWVTDATGDWKYLVGWATYAYGFTTDPNTWGDTYTATGYRAFLPPLPAKWGKLGM